jgi:Winged helix domain, variant/ATPase family associated with various cellular activities (AAA)
MILNEHLQPTSASPWQKANYAYVEAELKRLRLLLQRRVRWLRQQWHQDPLQSYQGLVISDAQADWLLLGEHRQAEARFYREDPEAAQLGRSIAELERHLAAQQRSLAGLGTPPALEVLAHLLGLTPFERDTLLLCLATELDPTFERLYAYLHDDMTRKYATPHLALSLFGGDGETWLAARDSFLPETPLRRFRLITLDSAPLVTAPLGTRPLRLDDRIADYLLGINRIDERLAALLEPLSPPLLAPHHGGLVDRLQQWIESKAQGGVWPTLNLIGPPGGGKRAVAWALCERVNLQPYGLDVARLPLGPELRELICLVEREAVLLQLGIYLDATACDPTEKATSAALNEVIEGLSVFCIVGSQRCWQTRRDMLAVPVPKPDPTAQRALWQRALEGIAHSLNGQLDATVQQFDLGPTAIAQAVTVAQGHARLRGSESAACVTAEDLWQACREQAGRHLDELAQRIIPCYTWEDIVLPDDIYRQLREIAAQVANRSQVYEVWGFGAKLSRGRGISALFAGASGTGKTMAAEILAQDLDLDLYRIDLSGVVSKYIGETEKNLRRVFDTAEQSGAILFFDEADALFGKRSEIKDSHDRYANIEINYLLQRMEDYRGLAILATNMKALLDQAFLRRLRFLVDFPAPDAALRLRIWQRVFPAQAAVDGLDYSLLARLEIPGGNIRNIALNAAFLAAAEGGPIRMEHVLQAARREYAKIDKLMLESEFGPYYAMVKR